MSERWFGISIKAIPQLESTCSGFDVDVMKCLTEFYSHTIEESSSPVNFLVTCLGAKKTKTLMGKTGLDFVWRQMQANLEAREPVNSKLIMNFGLFSFASLKRTRLCGSTFLNFRLQVPLALRHIRWILSLGHHAQNLCPLLLHRVLPTISRRVVFFLPSPAA